MRLSSLHLLLRSPHWPAVPRPVCDWQVYTEEAKKLGISLTECSHKVKEFSLTALAGDYRRLLVRPKNMSWSLLLYSHPDQDLGYTDLDAVLGNPKPELEILAPGGPLIVFGIFRAGQR